MNKHCYLKSRFSKWRAQVVVRNFLFIRKSHEKVVVCTNGVDVPENIYNVYLTLENASEIPWKSPDGIGARKKKTITQSEKALL